MVSDLGALSPVETNCSNAYQVNALGEIVGFSENGQVDPLVGFNQSRAVRWKNGEIEDLGSFGGNQNEATSINNRGQIVGFSQNTTSSNCVGLNFFPLGTTQLRAFLWEKGVMQDLGTLGGNCAIANYINEQGQVAGASETTTTPNPATGMPPQDPFLWKDGKMTDLGTLGGAIGFPLFLNNHGQVVGLSSISANPGACLTEGDPDCHPFLWEHGNLIDLDTTSSGGTPINPMGFNDAGEIVGPADFSSSGGSPFDAFLWRNGVATDLGALSGDCFSNASAINSHAQVVGTSFSCEFNLHHAFLWENGSIIDLNDVIPVGSALQLVTSLDINDRGEIEGAGVPPGVDPSNANTQGHAFLLIPCDENHPDIEGCDYSVVDAKAATAAQAATGPRDSKLSAAVQARGLPSSALALPAAPEIAPVRQLPLRRLGFGRFTRSVFQVTSDAAVTSGSSATLSPTSLTFSTRAIGTTSAADIVAFKNTGTTSLTISSIAITGTDRADFAQTHTCGSSLAAGASCNISVTFGPKASGTRTAILSVADNAAGSPQKVSLAGIGTTAILSRTSLNFGTVAVGKGSAAQTVALINVGTTTLTISNIAITGKDYEDFWETHNCGSSLAAGARCGISVTFRPTETGFRTAGLTVSDNATGSPQTVSFIGVGAAGCIPQGSLCYGPGPNRCCPAPRGHHAFCSNPTGIGTCIEN